MLTDTLTTLFIRDLDKLKDELGLYKKEANIWKLDGQILNTAGNLTLHLIGNLNAYIGAVLGGTGYVRNRPAEFSLRDIPRDQLIADIEITMSVIAKVLPLLSDADLALEFPEEISVGKVSTEFFLVHLATHLTYHLGQVNYHRRLLDI